MNLQDKNRAAIAIAEKHDIDIEDALDQMQVTTVWLISNENIKSSISDQISFLTATNIAQRVFGNAKCIVPSDIPNLLPFKENFFSELIVKFGGKLEEVELPRSNEVKILFGKECYDDNCIEAISSGWRGGINLNNQDRIHFKNITNPISLGPVASASIACYVAFCKVYEFNMSKIEMNTGISLWNLNAGVNWFKDANDGPENLHYPRYIWSLGLGHLGQAYLWTFALLNISRPEAITFLLHDHDEIGVENIGSQVLSFDDDVGKMKTRTCFNFLKNFGYNIRLIEKPYEKSDSSSEWLKNFSFLLSGVDNAPTRKNVIPKNLDLYLDGATNGKLSLFDSFTLKNVTQINKISGELWKQSKKDLEEVLHYNLYKRFEKEHQCGFLSNIGISTPFVGLFGSVIIISELLRALNKGLRYSIVSLQMQDLDSIVAIENGRYGTEFLRNAI